MGAVASAAHQAVHSQGGRVKITVLTLHVAIVGDMDALDIHQFEEVNRVVVGKHMWECNGVVTAVRAFPEFIAQEVGP